MLLMSASGLVPASAFANPLATEAQIAAEKAALRIEQTPQVPVVREQLRQVMLPDPGAQVAAGSASPEQVLDQWIRCHILLQPSTDQASPDLLWLSDNTHPTWFGQL